MGSESAQTEPKLNLVLQLSALLITYVIIDSHHFGFGCWAQSHAWAKCNLQLSPNSFNRLTIWDVTRGAKNWCEVGMVRKCHQCHCTGWRKCRGEWSSLALGLGVMGWDILHQSQLPMSVHFEKKRVFLRGPPYCTANVDLLLLFAFYSKRVFSYPNFESYSLIGMSIQSIPVSLHVMSKQWSHTSF